MERSNSAYADRTKSGKKHLRTILISIIPLIVLTFAASSHVLYAILNHKTFDWRMFSVWLVILVCSTILPLWTAWKYRRSLEPWQKLIILDLGGTLLWYWGFATIYQSMVMNFSPEQSAVNAFAFFWEVPIVGGLAALTSQWQFKRFSRYLKTGHTDNPEKLYRDAELLPFKAMIRNSIAAVLGFSIGVAQIAHFVGISPIEAGKDILLGLVVSIFVSLYFFLIFYALVSPIKSKLITQYKLKNTIKIHYHTRVLMVVIMLVLGTILLTTDVYINNNQKTAKETIKSEVNRKLDAISEADYFYTDSLDGLVLGENGKSFLLQPDDPLPLDDVLKSTNTKFETTANGTIEDNNTEPHLIIYRTIDNQKIVSVVHMNDFYAPLLSALHSIAISSLLVLTVSVTACILFVRVLSQTLRRLSEGMSKARQTGTYNESLIDTGDEFETISREFGHFVHETTEHSRKQREEHARLEASIRSLELGMLITDKENNILNINAAAQKLLFNKILNVKNLTNLNDQLLHPINISKSIDQSINQAKPVHNKNITYGSKYFDVVVAPIVADNESIIGTITVIQDVTEAKVIQRSKDEFFSIASHELRTPLTAIRGNTDIIKNFYAKTLKKNPELDEMITDIYDSSVRLINIVNDFLDVSRLEQGKMVFHASEFSLEHVIEAVVYDMRSNIGAKNISITIDRKTLNTLPKVWADESRTKQVLYNIIGNSAKFTDKGGITVKSHAFKDHIKISVVDTGQGIEPEMQKLLFRKFQQAGSSLLTRDATRGTGLGLYISKFMVEAMGGKMTLESSTAGKGSEFSFTLPLATNKRNPDKSHTSHVDVNTGISS